MKSYLSYLIVLIASTTSAIAMAAQEQKSTHHLSASSLKVATIDWTQTETLLALGVNPIAAAQVIDYNSWVKAPVIPSDTFDLGLRTQPNLERLSELKPDRIFISPMFQSLESQLSRIAPVTNIALYKKNNISWQALKDFTRTMASQTKTDKAAEELINQSEARLAQLAQEIPANTPKLIMIQFMDARHVRVFGDNSMYRVAANQIGLDSAWLGKTNAWGFSLVGIDKLNGIKGQLVIIDPLPAGVEQHLESDQFWQYLVEQTGKPVLRISPVWSFGAIPSTVRFATLLTDKLTKETK